MRPRNVAFFALAGMLLTSISVYSLTPPPGTARAEADSITAEIGRGPEGAPEGAGRGRFTAGTTVTLEGRVGHTRLLRGRGGETFLLLEARAQGEGDARAKPPVHLGLVIDRSGSMAGDRMENARRAALGAVDRLNDGDVVSVVAFDTQATTIVPPRTVDASSRSEIATAIRGIGLGGDTCVSCGLEEGMAQLDRTPDSTLGAPGRLTAPSAPNPGRVRKMILLSDGDANRGVVGLPGLRDLGRRAMTRGAAVTTIGVDVDYNEKILSAISQESNGRHYFVDDDASLARVFEAEAEAATTTLASNAEASIELSPGVEVVRVFDRSFRRSGDRLIVPLGAFSKGDVKTVLVQVRVPDRTEGDVPVARAVLAYRDLVEDREARCEGDLGVEITSDPERATEIDGVVAGRVHRSETAATLNEANDLFAQGQVEQARRRLQQQAERLRGSAPQAASAASPARKGDVDRDFKSQLDDLEVASNNFAAPAEPAPAGAPPPKPQATRQGKAAVKLNAERSFANGL